MNEMLTEKPEVATLDPAFLNRTLFEAMLDARDRRGGKHEFIEDAEREPMTLDRLLLGASVLSGKISALSKPKERVGLLLPNSNGAAVVFFSCHAAGRVPAMLNFSSGIKNLISCCETGQIKTVFTSRRFVALGKLEDLIEALEKAVKIVWLEDVRKSISTLDKIAGLIRSKFPRRMLAKTGTVPSDPAVVLFTSGTEGVPKGVVLSHSNMLANVKQIMLTQALREDDKVFNALPMFHSFGMTAAFILPVVTGMKVFMYPSPLHYRQIPPLVREFGATVLFGTDTFAVGWGKVADPEDFATIRFIVLGAERVKSSTRELWRERFGIELYEGYGATEASPVLACNFPGTAKEGSVGKLFTAIDHRIEPVPDLKEGGRLVIHGPNVMAGYITHDRPGELQPPENGWHDTGDIVEIDEDGFVFIKGRAKRFAKLGGEMVSLVAVENHVAMAWPDNIHAVASIADKRKGEQLVLITDRVKADRSELQKWAKANGVPELHLPKKIIFIDEMPVLGTGKMDYLAIQALAEG